MMHVHDGSPCMRFISRSRIVSEVSVAGLSLIGGVVVVVSRYEYCALPQSPGVETPYRLTRTICVSSRFYVCCSTSFHQ